MQAIRLAVAGTIQYSNRMQLLVSTLLLSGTVHSHLHHPGSAADVRENAPGAAAPGVFIATSRYIPAAPDSVGLCSFAVASRWSCNTSWAYPTLSRLPVRSLHCHPAAASTLRLWQT